MANYPSVIDAFTTNKASGNAVPSSEWNDRGTALNALEAKVGIDSSAVATSLDFLRKIPLGGTVRLVGTGLRYTTVASALSAASSGDLVLVTPGTYSESGLTAASGVSLRGFGINATIIQNTTTDGTAAITLQGSNNVSDIQFDADTGNSATGGVKFTGTNIVFENSQVNGTGDTFAVAASSNTGFITVRNNFILNPYADIFKILAQTGGNGAGGALVYEFIGNRLRFASAAKSALAVGGDFISVQAAMTGPPLINVIGNDIDWRINTAETFNITLCRIQAASAYATGTVPLVFRSAHNRLHGETTTKNVVLFQGNPSTGVGGTKFSPLFYSDSDVIEMVTSSGSCEIVNGSKLVVGAGHTVGSAFVSNCAHPDGAVVTANTDAVTLRGSTLNRSFAVADAATITINPNLARTQAWTTTQNITALVITTSGMYAGQELILQITDAGTHTVTYSTGTKTNLAASTQTNVIGVNVSRFVFDGTSWILQGAPMLGGV